MTSAVKIVIAGCSGRMGHALLEGVFADVELMLHGALDRANNPQKAITLESGLVVQAPMFINVGDVVKVNIERGEYLTRVNS